MIQRSFTTSIAERFYGGKAILLLGARQVGKTTFVKNLLDNARYDTLFLDCEDDFVANILSSPNMEEIKQIISKHNVIFIDEAQKVVGIGKTAKLIVDHFPQVQLILSGSSSFELINASAEPLTGRKYSYQIFPISFEEWENHIGYLKAEQDLNSRLVYGFYPDVLNHRDDQKTILKELSDSYLYRDVFVYGGIKKPDEIKKLLQAIAFQVGNEVSYTELAQMSGLDTKTVERYIVVLERTFILFRLQALSGNLRNEIKSKRKIYFYDNGIRNIVIGQLQPIEARNDVGALWENFLVSERQKQLSYTHSIAESYYWRTTQQQEVDYVEQIEGAYFAYEFKWNPKRKVKFSKTFTQVYGNNTKVISRENYRAFVKM